MKKKKKVEEKLKKLPKVGSTVRTEDGEGIITGLEVLKEKCDVEVYSDSAYVVNSINNSFFIL